MTHRYHPDPARNDPEGAIVWDDCEDCVRKVNSPGLLDNNNAWKAYRLMLAAERGTGTWPRKHYLTAAERALCGMLHESYTFFERLGLFQQEEEDDDE